MDQLHGAVEEGEAEEEAHGPAHRGQDGVEVKEDELLLDLHLDLLERDEDVGLVPRAAAQEDLRSVIECCNILIWCVQHQMLNRKFVKINDKQMIPGSLW